VAVAVTLVTVACSTRAPAESVILYYEAGAGENREWTECIEPGQSGSYPVDDEIFELPISLRTWNIRPEGGDTDRPITTGSKPAQAIGPDGRPTGASQPGPELLVWATADFYLNTDCAGGKDSPVVRFWEQTGRRYGISEGGEDGFKEDRWREMLLNTLVPAEEKAIRENSRSYSADDLDANVNGVWAALERQLGPAFNAALREKVGGDYFCGPQYRRGQDASWEEFTPDGVDANGVPKFRTETRTGRCPPVRISITDVGFANGEIAKARADVFAAEQRAKAALIDAESRAAVARQLEQVGNSPAYVELERVKAQLAAAEACRTNPNCTVIIDGTGAGGPVVGGR
jgi:hypothetical protein